MTQHIKVVYSPKMAVDQGPQGFSNQLIKSPSAHKPAELAEILKSNPVVEFIEPQPLTRDDIKLVHDPYFVDSILDLKSDNGFGNRSLKVANSLLYTNGAMYDAAKLASFDNPTCALVSGFHHAGYDRWEGLGYFCTFNGLMITAAKLIQDNPETKVAIIDCDMHWGNGTDHILESMLHQFKDSIAHISFGKTFFYRKDAQNYLDRLKPNGIIEKFFNQEFNPNIILYQAGADVHINDPYGGIFTTEQIFERDLLMFQMAKKLNVPITWNLAGGYQIDSNGSIQKVLDIHLNTFKACQEAYF